ncbi:MAG TPA: ABC transporter permease [Candidatus Limnocylindrales bacterium]
MGLIGGIVAWFTDPAHWRGNAGVPVRVEEQLGLAAIALLIAAVIGLTIGLWVGHTGRGASIAVNLANLGRSLPTLAVMAIVVPITAAIDADAGFKVWPAIVGLVILGIPPLLVNAYAGVAGVDPETVEAGRASGMRGWQVLWRIELPIAIPVILAGVRSAASQIVATATLAAIFGGPGLGRYLVEGYAQLNYPMMWAGVILVGLVFAAVETLLAIAQRALTSPGLRLLAASRPA